MFGRLCKTLVLLLFLLSLFPPTLAATLDAESKSDVRTEVFWAERVPYDEGFALPTSERQLSICERKSESSIFVFGKCPEVCMDFTPSLFTECGPLIQFGCRLESCGSGKFICTFTGDVADTVTVCPGDKLVFDSVDIKRLEEIKYTIDLKAPPVFTDVYILSDATGSMGTAIGQVRTKILDILSVFAKESTVAFGLGFYRDETELTDGFRNILKITTDRSQTNAAVMKLQAAGGGDGDEANLVGIYQVATQDAIGWRPRSRRILVYFGDWPGHEPTCVGELRLKRNDVVAALNAKGITVISVSFPPPGLDAAPRSFPISGCLGETRAATGQATFITNGTSGNTVASADQAELIANIKSAISGLKKTYDVDTSDCDANVNSVHSPALPITLSPKETATVTNTFKIKPSICEAIGKFECEFKYTESNAALETTNLEIVNVKGC